MSKRSSLFARFDLDYADHPKIAPLSDAAFRAHVEMILYSRRYLTDGRIAKRIANRWGTEAVTELLTNDPERPSLVELDDGDYLLHEYSEMQETRDEVERRKAVNRENGKRGGRPANRTKTQSVSDSGTENLTEMKAETETETEVLPPVGPPRGDAAKSDRKRPARPIPEDWSPTDAHEAKAQQLGLDVHQVAEEFVNWAISKDERKADWSAAFHNWLAREAKYRQDRASRPPISPRGQAKEDQNIAILAAWAESKNQRQNELPFPGGDPA
jgi:hypothetical protein